MDQTLDIDAIVARRSEIAAEIERLHTEDGELEIAIRVIRRFGKEGRTNGTGVVPSKLGPPRPENTPSLIEMTETVLRDAIAAGSPGLKGLEIVAEIGKMYWPGVQGRQILPPIYKFVKSQRLQKDEQGIFSLASGLSNPTSSP